MNALLFDETLAEALERGHGHRGQWLDYQRRHSAHPKWEAESFRGQAKPLMEVNRRIIRDREELRKGNRSITESMERDREEAPTGHRDEVLSGYPRRFGNNGVVVEEGVVEIG